MSTLPEFFAPISETIWQTKYRFDGGDGAGDSSVSDTFRRVARSAASVETGGAAQQDAWADKFYHAMADFRFLPAGRILAGAGTGRGVTLFNCFVMGRIADDLGDIFDHVKQAALTMQLGGGIGQDFSTLRPRGAVVRSLGADASGPLRFMDVWDAMCQSIRSAGARRGAMMGTLRVDHPDIEEFIDVKSDPARLRNFNISVLVTDQFMDAVKQDKSWDLVFDEQVYRTVSARDLWQRILRASYDYAEPGVIFIDRINALNNLSYCEDIFATNPCGEQPLPPYGACLLGSINLARFVDRPFQDDAVIDVEALAEHAALAVRFLDNIIDVSSYPLDAQREEAHSKRRIGLGVTGLADALAMLGVRYGTLDAASLASSWMDRIKTAAYLASAELASERGAFPLYQADAFLSSPNVAALKPDVRAAIKAHGIRNGCLISIAPTGTISLFAGNVSSGVEPVFDFSYLRRVLEADGGVREEVVEDYAYRLFREAFGPDAALTDSFVRSADLLPAEHLLMQAALQSHVDSSISKTINCPEDLSFEAFEGVYSQAYDLGLKGCTAYRPNNVTGAVLVSSQSDSVGNGPGAVPGHLRSGDQAGYALPGSSIGQAPIRGGDEVVPPVVERDVDLRWSKRTGSKSNGSGKAAASSAHTTSGANADVIYMTKSLEREPVLSGWTYKLLWPDSDQAYYITINDIEENGRRRPFELFINTRNLEHSTWILGLTRMISAVFRRGGDVAFIAEELGDILDPRGGQWVDGRFMGSVLAAIGDVIDAHMRRIGFLVSGLEEAAVGYEANQEARWASGDVPYSGRSGAADFGRNHTCSECDANALVKGSGCWTCRDCGYSRCE